MPSLDPPLQLRDGETIRAYLDELARLKIPVQLWLAGDARPFSTILQSVSPITFSCTTTPQMTPGQMVDLTFQLEARRFAAQVKVITSGVFRIPASIAQGERRAEYRGTFSRAEGVQVVIVEQCCETLLGGRVLEGRLIDLTQSGFRIALEPPDNLSGPGAELKAGDRFALVCITGLPFTPPVHGRATLAHVAREGAEPFAGFALEGLREADRTSIERILAPRRPATFGEAFPAKKRKTELADELGTPTLVKVKARAPEIVGRAAPAPVEPERAASNAVVRLRKAGKKILVLSDHASTPALVEILRADGYKNLAEAASFPDAKVLAGQVRFDLLLLDFRVGRHWGGDILASLRALDLLLDTPIILLVEHRNTGSQAIGRAMGASWLHERATPGEDLLPVLHKLLLEDP